MTEITSSSGKSTSTIDLPDSRAMNRLVWPARGSLQVVGDIRNEFFEVGRESGIGLSAHKATSELTPGHPPLLAWNWTQDGYRVTVDGDHDLLASLDTPQDTACAVA